MSLSFHQYGNSSKKVEDTEITKKKFTGIMFSGSIDDLLREMTYLKLKYSKDELDALSLSFTGSVNRR